MKSQRVSQKSERERVCAVCRQSSPSSDLVRWVRAEDGSVVPDLQARAFGRGAWVHPLPQCLKKLQPALQKSFKAQVGTSTSEALNLLAQAGRHRVGQLLGQGRRQGSLIYGTQRTGDAFRSGEIELVLVANDAQAAADADFVREAIAAGLARSWSTKAELGALFGRAEIALLGVQDRGLAKRLFGAIAMALLVQQVPPDGK